MATIKDVAREAGVSVATVSRVFNDSGQVSEDTRKHVRQVADRLNYWPNGVARSLITNRTHSLGVLLPDMHGEFFSEVIRGIDLTARNQNLHLLVSSSHSEIDALIASLLSLRGRIDGLIVMAPDVDAPAAIRACIGELPIVMLNPGLDLEECDSVSIANYDGAYQTVKHLMSLGHRRIAIVKGPERNIDARQRLYGYRRALADGGGEMLPALEVRGDFREASGSEAAAGILRLSPRPTAVFAANDYMAVGLISALREAGLRVPEDMAVAGFDDIPIARFVSPPLTTVQVDAFALGQRAVELLLPRTQSKKPADYTHDVLPTTLVVRASSGSRRDVVSAAGETTRREPQAVPLAGELEPS